MATAPLGTFERAAGATVRFVTYAVLLFLVTPILAVIPLSFTAGTLLVYPLPGWSTQWYQDFFTNPLWTRAIWNSLFIASVTTVAATLLGTLAALGLHWSKWRVSRLVAALLISPLVTPVVIIAVAMFYFLAGIGLAATYTGIIAAHTVLAIPFVVITVSATLKGLDINLVRAALSLGAVPHVALRRVILPMIAPGVVSGALFAFVTSFDEIVVVLFIASPNQRTLPRQIFSGVTESISPTITAAAVVLVIVSVALLSVVEVLRRRAERLGGAAV